MSRGGFWRFRRVPLERPATGPENRGCAAILGTGFEPSTLRHVFFATGA